MLSGLPVRALVLPALAVLVPSAFIVVLASTWLTLAHETTRLRSSEAAASALVRLRSDLLASIAAEADRAAREAQSPILLHDIVFFDDAWRVAGPAAMVERAPASGDITRKAGGLLAQGAAALENGALQDVRRTAHTLMECCADARDEFGVSYALYASWQLVALNRRQPAISSTSIVRPLRAAIDRGLLDRPTDVAGVRQVVDQMAGAPGAAGLLAAVSEHVAREERRRRTVAAARSWLTALGSTRTTASDVVVAPWLSNEAPIAGVLWTGPARIHAVATIDRATLTDWVARWSTEQSPFTFAVGQSSADVGTPSVFVAPLVPDLPAIEVVAHGPSRDPVGDRLRERLFTAAAIGVVVLTLLAGGLAARDVVRERRMATLRATFLAGVTHEIKTPLTSIRLMAETLQQGRATAAMSPELLGTIVNEAEHLSDLVDNLLSTSRIESGARTYRPRVVDFVESVRAARRRVDYALAKDGFALVEQLPEMPIRVHADSDALVQAVLNLLGNAMKYSGASREIRLIVDADDTHARLRVADDGLGVAPGEQARIFKSFYRTASAESLTTGAGLGLALVRHFADAHGGEVSVESAPGRGSVFTIVLPRERRPICASSRATPRALPMADILIVEDDRAIVRGLETNLQFEGHHVRAVVHGDEAEAAIAAARPDLLVLDVMLPGLSGFEICRRVRGADRQLPILMLTARGEDVDKAMGLDLGADDYLTKPFSLTEFLARVRALLRRAATSTTASRMGDLAFSDVRIDFSRFEAERDGAPVHLTAREFALLRELALAAGAAVRRDVLLDSLCGEGVHVTTRTVDTHILALRQKLEPDPAKPRHFVTVHGVGYRFVARP